MVVIKGNFNNQFSFVVLLKKSAKILITDVLGVNFKCIIRRIDK